MKSKICPRCGTQFTGGRSDKKYCTRRCKERSRRKRYAEYKSTQELKCIKCGFIPVHRSQLDVDHIDGNKHNNNVSNLQILCANCHRLKTHINRDYHK